MAKITILILLFINLLLPSSLLGQSNPNSIYSFLDLPVSPRAAGLSRHLVSQANPDLFSSISNPAYLDSSFHQNVQVGYYSHFADVSMSAASYSHYIPKIGQLTTTIRYLSYGDLEKFDENGFQNGSFSSYDFALSTSVSRNVYKNLNAGISFTFIRSAIDQFSSHALLGTFGLYYEIPEELTTIGFSIRDAGFQLNAFKSTKESVPYDISFGITKKFQHVPFRFTLTSHSLQQWSLRTIYDSKEPDFTTNLIRHLAFGGEFLFTESFVLRFGMNKYQADALITSERLDFSGTAFGASFKISRFQIDLSRTSYSTVGAHFQLSLATSF